MDHPLYPKFEEWYRSQNNLVSRLAYKDILWKVYLAGIEAQQEHNQMLVEQQQNFFKSGKTVQSKK